MSTFNRSMTIGPSKSPDVVAYRIYVAPAGEELNYSSPSATVQKDAIAKPIPPAIIAKLIPGGADSIRIGVTAVDGAGNETDMQVTAPIPIDVIAVVDAGNEKTDMQVSTPIPIGVSPADDAGNETDMQVSTPIPIPGQPTHETASNEKADMQASTPIPIDRTPASTVGDDRDYLGEALEWYRGITKRLGLGKTLVLTALFVAVGLTAIGSLLIGHYANAAGGAAFIALGAGLVWWTNKR